MVGAAGATASSATASGSAPSSASGAAALGTSPEALLGTVEPEAAAPEAPAELTDAEKELLQLFKSADADTQNAAVAALKGEKPAASNVLSMLGGVLGGGQAAQGGEGGEGGQNALSGLAGMLGGVLGSKAAQGGEGGEGGQNALSGLVGMLGGVLGGGQKQEAPKEEQPEEPKE